MCSVDVCSSQVQGRRKVTIDLHGHKIWPLLALFSYLNRIGFLSPSASEHWDFHSFPLELFLFIYCSFWMHSQSDHLSLLHSMSKNLTGGNDSNCHFSFSFCVSQGAFHSIYANWQFINWHLVHRKKAAAHQLKCKDFVLLSSLH